MSLMRPVVILCAAVGALAASVAAQTPAKVDRFDRIARAAFNARAAELNQPLFWRADANGDGALQPEELAVTWRYEPLARKELVDGENRFTEKFRALYERILRPDDVGQLRPGERERRAAVRRELAQGRPTLIESDFSTASHAEKNLLSHLVRVAALIERLYARQRGTAGLERGIPADDAASAALFFRNQGPFCTAPKTEHDPACRALPEPAKPVFGLYPADLQKDSAFCASVQKQPNAAQLTDHFSNVVRAADANGLLPVRYSRAYQDDMEAVARELEAAAAELDGGEGALKSYLRAAAKAFRDDDWESANEAWIAMGDGRSKYYLRVAPDEVYFEPCGWKAGFAFAFGRINEDAAEWQGRLAPIKQDMEADFARLAGPPYRARQVRFKLPDFVDIVLNAGINRFALGIVAGQSLPNWGPWADRGGRTMIVSNIDADADTRASLATRAASLYCRATAARFSTDPKLEVMTTIMHEAAHNLGPARTYEIEGRVDQAVFGGPLASLLEELKAETAAIYFPELLVRKKLVPRRDADVGRAGEVAYAFGSVAQGMFDSQGRPKTYSQISSVILGALQRGGVLEWRADELAGNARDRGCFELHDDRWQAAVAPLARQVLRIKSKGDRAAAERLLKPWIDDSEDNEWRKLRALIAERWLREPRGAYVYSMGGL
jgi:hypothetical protein